MIRRSSSEDTTYYPHTKWIKKTVIAASGVDGRKGWYNGYQLSEELQQAGGRINSLEDTQLTLVNHKQQTINEVVGTNGGSFFATESKVQLHHNLNLEVSINLQALEEHKDLIREIGNEVWKSEQQEYQDTRPTILRSIERRLVAGRWASSSSDTKEFIIGGVKYNALPTYIKSLIDSELSSESLRQRFNEIDKLQSIARGNPNHATPIIYTEASTGRYTAKDGTLQSYRKSVRYAALQGYCEYDLEAAHQNILLQLLYSVDNRNLSQEEIDGIGAIQDYTRYKSDTRLNLFIDVDCEDMSQIKEAMQALTYGAYLVDNPFQAIANIFNNDKQVIDRFTNHPLTQRYKAGFDLAHRVLVGDAQEITNAVGITKPREGKSKDLAHILQGHERSVIDAIIKHSNKDDIALLLHDCIVFYNKQDTDILSAIVKKETGFDLEFSKECY